MTKIKFSSCIYIYLIFNSMCSCLTAGTHGSLKNYEYPVTKAVLQQAVNGVIHENLNIKMKDTIRKNNIVDITNGSLDTLLHKQNNDYVDILLMSGEDLNDYTFQYSCNQDDCETQRTSEISIAYAHDKNGKGGSEGNGDFPWYKPALKSEMIKVFEKEFINKIDKKLGVKHIVN